MKDPAFLFYYQDFIVGTAEMNITEIGAYILCLCYQADKGFITEKHMKNICNSNEVYQTVKSKFISEDDGKTFFNKRLRYEIERRKAYTESRRNNIKKRYLKKQNIETISPTYVAHMENENEIVNENRILEEKKGLREKREKKKETFIKPTLDEVIQFFQENSYSREAAIKAWNYYNDGNWKDSEGKPVLSWKQKMRVVWFKDEYKIKEQPKREFLM